MFSHHFRYHRHRCNMQAELCFRMHSLCSWSTLLCVQHNVSCMHMYSTVVQSVWQLPSPRCCPCTRGLPAERLRKLQKVQNACAVLICWARKRDQVTPLLFELHWLPISARIAYKTLLLCGHIGTCRVFVRTCWYAQIKSTSLLSLTIFWLLPIDTVVEKTKVKGALQTDLASMHVWRFAFLRPFFCPCRTHKATQQDLSTRRRKYLQAWTKLIGRTGTAFDIAANHLGSVRL